MTGRASQGLPAHELLPGRPSGFWITGVLGILRSPLISFARSGCLLVTTRSKIIFMSLLQRLLGRDDKFFQLLENCAAEAKSGASSLARVVEQIGHGSIDETMGDLAQSRRKHKRLSQEITEELCKKFATPLDREDIEALSSALYKISKNVEKIGERLTIAPPGAKMESVGRQISLLEQSAAIVNKMVGELRAQSHSELIKDDYERLQVLEGEADRVMNDLLRHIYQGESDARMVVFWKDIYELLEKGIDRCRDTGYVVFNIVLKNS